MLYEVLPHVKLLNKKHGLILNCIFQNYFQVYPFQIFATTYISWLHLPVSSVFTDIYCNKSYQGNPEESRKQH